MCLIITSKNGKEISKEYLESGYDSNHHGAGIAYVKDGKLIVKKGFFKFDDFYEAYKECIGNPHLIHQRWATAGLKDEENCHPFIFAEENEIKNGVETGEKFPVACLVHNGVLTSWSHKIKDKSDTFAFTEMILKPLTNDVQGKFWWKNSGLQWLLSSAICSNKFAILDSEGNIEIFNEDLGEYIDEEKTIWASNSMWKTKKVRTVPNYAQTQSYTRFMGYESDYMAGGNTQTQPDQTQSTVLTKEKTSTSSKITIDKWKEVSEEELAEIDAYLDELNSVN